MNYSNQQNYNNLINWLMNYCFDHDIGACLTNELPDAIGGKSYVIPADLVVVNNNWHNELEIPFIIGHELGHLMLGHKRKEFDESPTKRILMERAANEYSLYLLTEYCDLHEIYFYDKYTFAHAFGIPKDCYYLLEEQA